MNHPAPVFSGPVETLRSGVRQRQWSATGLSARRRLREIAVAALILLLAGVWQVGIAQFLAAAAGTVAVVAASRMILSRCSLPRAWRWGLLVTGIATWIPGVSDVGEIFFILTAVGFLGLRRYRVYGELDSRWRAAAFGLALGLVIGLIATDGPDDVSGSFAEMLRDVHGSARVFLALFSTFTIIHLFLGIRLHFLRLRPKLAVAGLLIAAVPVVLLLALSAVAVFSTLGGSRATQTRSVLSDWLEFHEDAVRGGADSGLFGPPPETDRLVGEVADAVAHAPYDPMPGSFFLRDQDRLWAVTIDTTAARPALGSIHRVTPATLTRLAENVGCEVLVVGNEEDTDIRVDLGGVHTSGVAMGYGSEQLRGRPSLAPGFEQTDPDAPWAERWVLFGGTTFPVYELEDGGLSRSTVVLSLSTRPVDLWNVYADGDNEINQAILIALVVLAVLFLLLEALALYFGLRITGGITLAVGRLHRATQRLARGDLDVHIELANEDEFGDLADSFNEMTRAIRLAQDQLVQKQRLEQEIATARQIQQRLLPDEMPVLAGYEISGSSNPSRMVGGDYFDFLPLADGRLGVCVADVSGKGIPAALLMSNLQASLQAQAQHPGPVASMVQRMNDTLAASTDDHMFATFFYAVLDPDSGDLIAVNAGHEPPLLVRADGEVERLEPGGLILGMLAGQVYRETEARLEPGDVLVVYTDGITEAMGPGTRIPGMEDAERFAALPPGTAAEDQMVQAPEEEAEEEADDEIVTDFFEEHRLQDVVVGCRHESAESIRRAVLAAVDRHTAGVPQSDDTTLVVLKRTTTASGRGPRVEAA